MAFATSSPSISSAAYFAAVANPRSSPATVRLPRRTVTSAHVSERVHVAQPQQQPQRSAGSLYDVLGIRTGATCREIKAAYRKLARSVHPDVAGNNDNGTNGQSSGYEFIEVHEAYATLSDPERRAEYDRVLITHRLNSSLAMAGASRYGGYASGKNWETDQCW